MYKIELVSFLPCDERSLNGLHQYYIHQLIENSWTMIRPLTRFEVQGISKQLGKVETISQSVILSNCNL
jgi:hypothetical protein